MQILFYFILSFILSVSTLAQGSNKIRFVTHWLPQAQFAGYYYAFEKGIYRKYGLDVQITHTPLNTTAQEILIKGDADIASMFFTTALEVVAKGNKIVNFSQISQKSGMAVVGRKELGINTVKDLDGKRTGIWESGFREIPLAFFEKNGIKPELVPIRSTVNMFLQKAIDAMVVMYYNEYNTITNAGINNSEISLFLFSDYNMDIIEDGLYSTTEFYDKNKDLCVKFAKATFEGYSEAFKNQEETLDILRNYMLRAKVPFNKAHQRWMLNAISNIFYAGQNESDFGSMPVSKFFYGQDVLISAGILKKKIELKDFYRESR